MSTSARPPGAATSGAASPITLGPAARIGSWLNDDWKLDALLGTGGMGVVFAATHRDGRRAALKVLHDTFKADPDVRARFFREGRIASSVDHPGRVSVYGDGESALGEVFLVMELLEGETFGHLLKRSGGKQPVDVVLKVFDDVLDLLAKCHAAQIIHRDIKPENIFLCTTGEVKVVDFGVARLRSSGRTLEGTALGTPSFMSPEQALGKTKLVDHRSDLWSVGACIYVGLVGKTVHAGRDAGEALAFAQTKKAVSLRDAAPDMPDDVVALVDRALAPEQADRFPDASAMQTAVRAALRSFWARSLRLGSMSPPRPQDTAQNTRVIDHVGSTVAVTPTTNQLLMAGLEPAKAVPSTTDETMYRADAHHTAIASPLAKATAEARAFGPTATLNGIGPVIAPDPTVCLGCGGVVETGGVLPASALKCTCASPNESSIRRAKG